MFVAGDLGGDLRLFHIPTRTNVVTIPKAHTMHIAGVAYLPDGEAFLSCARDKAIRLWNASTHQEHPVRPISEWQDEEGFTCLSQHSNRLRFATAGTALKLWDINRTRPLQVFSWGFGEVVKCAFNLGQANLIACSTQDRGIILYDMHTERAAQKVVLQQRTNDLCWNPMEPMDLIAGNENGEIYLFDCRKLGRPKRTFAGHVDAVTSVAYAPTGKEFVSGAADKTLRVWTIEVGGGQSSSRDMYHAIRMQRVQSVAWTLDNTFVLSGSTDCNVRMWKAQASKPLKPLVESEKRNLQYSAQLLERYKQMPVVHKIEQQKFTPKAVKKKTTLKERKLKNAARRLKAVRIFSTPKDADGRILGAGADDYRNAREVQVLGLVD